MSIPVSEPVSTGNFKQLDPGTYAAVCDSVINLGVQRLEFQGEVNDTEQVYLRFEVPSERLTYIDKEGHEQNKPMVISVTLTNSLHEKARLRHYLESWRGQGFTAAELEQFDLTNILGKPCLLTVVHKTSGNGKTYANIASISKLMKGMDTPKAENPLIGYHPEFAPQDYEKLPKWIKEKLDKRIMPTANKVPVKAKDDFEDSDIPF